MSEVVHEARQEFWQPPATVTVATVVQEEAPMAEACPRCGSEFLLGSHFCHSCGSRRPEAQPADANADPGAVAGLWVQALGTMRSAIAGLSLEQRARQIKFPAWLRYLHFHEIQKWVGLSTASLVAFIIGISCVAGALLVGLLTAKTLIDWQAIQFYRAEWLLAATASFVAAILLKRPSPPNGE
jgi:uncharacterized protein (DUF983 family)